ncbi:MAG: protoporphyrinogen oxidase [Candidatus Kapabacteria bacterium]|nr:protoporphyrinogen oxidase [Candidatus Kapabacteria bacterium]
MEKSQKYDVVVIGGGLTGLTLAYYLKKAGVRFLLLESNKRVGGVIQTITEDGFVFETGPNSGIISSIEAVELFDELKKDCNLEIANPNSNDRWIWKKGKWHSLPTTIPAGIKTKLFSLGDKLKLLTEPFLPKGKNPDETVADLVLRRLGKSFLDYAVDPFISGIYAGNPYKLVTRHALPKLYNLEQNYGSFIRGAIKKKFEPKNPSIQKVSREIFSMELGMQKLIDALENKIGNKNILLNINNLEINPKNQPYKINYDINGEQNEILADNIVTTTGAASLINIFRNHPEIDISDIANLKYTKVVQLIAGYKNWQGIKLKAFGGLVPSVEKRDILGLLFISSLFHDRAPKGGALISAFMGGERRPDIIEKSDSEITQIVKSEIADMLGHSTPEPDLLKIFRYERAIPQYEASSQLRFEQIARIENEFKGLILAGNIRSGIGMADRIAQGRQIADKLIKEIK